MRIRFAGEGCTGRTCHFMSQPRFPTRREPSSTNGRSTVPTTRLHCRSELILESERQSGFARCSCVHLPSAWTIWIGSCRHRIAPEGMPGIAFTYEMDGQTLVKVFGDSYPIPGPDNPSDPCPFCGPSLPDNATRWMRKGYYLAVRAMQRPRVSLSPFFSSIRCFHLIISRPCNAQTFR